MKKVLYATTALVATAGIAAAQDADLDTGVTITGFAELGVFDGGEDSRLQFHTDIDATFTMTTETDSGLQFGASIDLDETDTDQTLPIAVDDSDGDGIVDDFADIEVGGSPAFDNALQGGEEIFINGSFGTLTMGDTDGAFDWALQEAVIGGTLNDDEEHLGYSGNAGLDGTYDGQIARYEYAFGDFGVAVSAELDDDDSGDPVLGIGARYSTAFGSFRGNPIGIGLGLGYQRIDSISIGDDDDDDDDTDKRDIYGISADLDLGGGLRTILNFSEGDTEDADTFQHVGVAVGYTVDALTVAANYGHFNNPGVLVTDDDDVPVLDELGVDQFDDGDTEGYGLTVNYDLGGGAEAQFGYSYNEAGDSDFNRYSAGIAISF